MLTDWQRWFPDCEPVAHHLRVAFPDRWTRFHSLPGSKRYPEDEAEYATVLERFNRILGELARPGQGVILLSTSYSESPEPVDLQPELQALDPGAVLWRTVAMHDVEDDFAAPFYWHVFASGREWRPGVFDPLVRLVADDVVANVMIVSPDCRWLLHPYDGGMDVIAESPEARDRLKASYSEWLSARPDGL
ncbi:MAG TPA: hypothetical protein VF756_05785 [Thermoanaerobaculia bacterium]